MGNMKKLLEIREKLRDIKLFTKERGRNYQVSEPNYHNKTFHREIFWKWKRKIRDTYE